MDSSSRRTYGLISFTFIVAVIIYIHYPWSPNQRPQIFQNSAASYNCDPNEPVKRVAIIGAGSAGSSVAYYLSKYTQKCNRINLTIYERSPYIGGRSTTVNAYDSPSEPVELGASIFVQVNRNLISAVEEFGLSTQRFPTKEEEYAHDLGIYNGREWVYIQDNGDSYWWSTAKLLWRYGIAPIRTRNLMKRTTGSFFKLYDAPHFPFIDLSQVVYDVGLTHVTAVTGETYLQQNGVGEQFGREVIQASTRVNYAQNLDTIHGVETMVCMATDGAMSVAGGNWQIFANMVFASKADVKLETSVTALALQTDGTYHLTTRSYSAGQAATSETNTATYDHVVLAAPLQFANLTITPQPAHPPSAIPYVNLHVTLFTSPYRLDPLAFNLPITDHVPATVLTTLPRKGIYATSPFYSISTLRSLTNPSSIKREYLYKIFSPAPVSDNYLHRILFTRDRNAADGNTGHDHDDKIVTWKYEKLWQSYPVESPRITFEDLIIDLGESHLPINNEDRDASHGGHLWYTSGIESFISTMETSSLMGSNVARLIVDGWISKRKEAEGERNAEAQESAGVHVTEEL